ncbi:Glycosaminoglycan xylosylkinase [Nymphon striatum]|nr:Glycosaminoglycan xylosylkinase [Nymphon striatum]
MELRVYRTISRLKDYWIEIGAFLLILMLLLFWLAPSLESTDQLYHDSVARGRFEFDDSPVEHGELLRKFGEKRVFNVPSATNKDEPAAPTVPVDDPREIVKNAFYKPIKQTSGTKLISISVWKAIKKQKKKFKKNNLHYALSQSLMDELNWKAQLRISPWIMAQHWVQPAKVIPDVCSKLGSVLHAMTTTPIINVTAFRAGSNLKVMLHLEGGQKAVFKPLLHPITEIIEGPSYVGADRHYGEIASFHLNRLLGFNRAPIVVGRRINLRREILPVATPEIAKTFFSNGPNMCFYGVCTYCRKEFSACGKGDVLDGSMTLFLPLEAKHMELVPKKNPWIRTYQDGFVAKWQIDRKYCKNVIADRIYHKRYNKGRELLDLIDMSIFDFLIGNGDRAQYEMFNVTGAAILLLDNGKSFNNPNLDDIEILAPLYECCK